MIEEKTNNILPQTSEDENYSVVEARVIQPYYSDALITLYNTDYRNVIGSLPPIQTVVTDPPFNAGKEFDNDNMSELDFRAFCNQLALDMYKIKPQNILVEVGRNDKIMRQELERYFDYEYAISLAYTNSMRNGKVGYHKWGLVLWFGNNAKCYNRYKDQLDAAVENNRDEFRHPSPKMVNHYKRLIDMFTDNGGTVFEPFAGSGTTLLAARLNGRKAIGCEISKEYCDIIVKRLSQIELEFVENKAV
jgi:site-specific DNA-methyltransferase (adenine-specific)